MVNDGAWLANSSMSSVHVGKRPPTFAVLLVLPGPSMITVSPTTGGAPVDQLSPLVQMGLGPAPVQVSLANALKLSSAINTTVITNHRCQDVAEVSDWAVDFI